MSEEQTKTYKVTLKAGEGYAEPWVTVEGQTEAELAFALKDLVDKGTFSVVAGAAAALRQAAHGVRTAEQTLGGQVQQGPLPQQEQWPSQQQEPAPEWAQGPAQQQTQQAPQEQRGQKFDNDYVGKGGHWPPAGPRPTCAHGPRDWKSFTAKSGNLTEMWSCPLDRRGAFIPDGMSKCDVEWANKR